MNNFFRKVKLALSDRGLRKKIFFVFGFLIIFRFLAVIPIPGIDIFQLQNFLQENQFFGLLNLFSGGGLSQLSIIMLGVGPYITSSIIMQLMTTVSPKLKELFHESGEIGKKKFNQYSRILTLPIAAIQGFGLLTLLSRQGILQTINTTDMIFNVLMVTAGAVLIMWIGELISEFGIGNGVSILIFAGIVASLPSSISQFAFTFDMSQIFLYIGMVAFIFIIVAGVVLVNEAERPIPITYSKQVRGSSTYGGTQTYIPLRVNQAGVMPIIFAMSILLFPSMIANFLANSSTLWLANMSNFILDLINNGWFYSIAYFILVFLFTYFYTAITFDPETMATNLQKNGAFVPGIRPGGVTSDYISAIVTRITFFGALFLGAIAVLPIILQSVTGNQTFAIGGTALLIVVSVVLDLFKKLDAQVSMREY